MSTNIHQGDIGTVFTVTIIDDTTSAAIDVSTATTKQIIFRKPDKSLLTATATFTTDGSDGKITYSTVSGDLSQPGLWKIQGKVIAPTFTNSTENSTFNVKKNL